VIHVALSCFVSLAFSSVLKVGENYYYDVTFMLINTKFQLEFNGPGQGMRNWFLSSYNLGRLSRGATVRLGGLGEILEGVDCSELGYQLCIRSAIVSDHYLVARENSRIEWLHSQSGASSQCAKFSVYCTDPYSTSLNLSRCQLVLGMSRTLNQNFGYEIPEQYIIIRIYDQFLVWCYLQDCWYGPPTSYWKVNVINDFPSIP